ncbi:retrotransposon hot spot (RHS) protein [Trypanosoma conorhini]|uniref:Retrotransposon hot spot (RHS) protein n=1 Tax=Trypanosoma conorhini TaxID=83891 RepID=A0A3R7N4Y4_9TRYP|nr:retrotransposon hot spot (RHS) protein [Trypanosoma conorhini]RNF00276.1 retrotransposon hot spot (RHS) protein [Trypanosoma conorhini]
MEHEVGTLQDWKDFDQKNIVSAITRTTLRSALAAVEEATETARKKEEERKRREEERAKRIDEIASQPLPDGFYDSVLNAKCSHVLEFSEGEGDAMVVRMEVREGQPPAQLWEYTQYGLTLLPVEDAEQFIPPRPRLMLLSSKHEWPYSLRQGEDIADCYVNREVDRVWRIVQGDLEGEFGTDDLELFKVRRRLVIGTPGIGKSMNAGSYLLHRLLQYDIAKLQVVVYCFGGDLAFVFDKEKKTVTACSGAGNVINHMNALLWQRKLKGYVIYDVDEKGHGPSGDYPPKSWGITVLSSPNDDNFKGWEKQKKAKRIVMNCPDELDVKAMCAWRTRDKSAAEQAQNWEMVKKHMDQIGPIPRCIFSGDEIINRLSLVDIAVGSINASNAHNYVPIGQGEMVPANDASSKLVKAARMRRPGRAESFANLPVCLDLGHKILSKMTEVRKQNDIVYQLLCCRDLFLPEFLEKYGVHAFTDRGFVNNIKGRIKELKPPTRRPGRPCVLQSHPEKHPEVSVVLELLSCNPARIDVNYGVLYVPDSRIFPLIDGFFFVDTPRKTMIGLQATVGGAHHTQPSKVRLFMESMAKYFNDWETLAAGLSWEIIYVQHRERDRIKKWQKCGNSTNAGNKKDAAQIKEAEEAEEETEEDEDEDEDEAEVKAEEKDEADEKKAKRKEEKEDKEIADCWKENVYQYQVAISAEDIGHTNNAQSQQQPARQGNEQN